MNGAFPTDPDEQRRLFAFAVIDGWIDEAERASWELRLTTEPCCAEHPDWTIQSLDLDGTITLRRLIPPSGDAYVEDVPTGPERRFVTQPGTDLPPDLPARARHALDGEPWRPSGGAPRSRRSSDELAATVLRLTVRNNRAPRQVDVCAEPGYPATPRRLGDILVMAGSDGQPRRAPWRRAYRLADLRAGLLDHWGNAGRLDLAETEDEAYLQAGPDVRARARTRLAAAGGFRRPETIAGR